VAILSRPTILLPNPGSAPSYHIAWAFYIHSTRIYDVWKAVFRSYITSNDLISLTPVGDAAYNNKFLNLLPLLFPTPKFNVHNFYSYEPYFYNAVHRVLGYYTNSIYKFPRSRTYFSSFFSKQEALFESIARAIYTKNWNYMQIIDVGSIAEIASDIQSGFLENTTNTVYEVTQYWSALLSQLIALLEDDVLIRDKFGIVTQSIADKLILLGAKVGIQVPRDALYRFDLANKINDLFLLIEKETWDVNAVNNLLRDENNWKIFFNAFKMVHKIDFIARVLNGSPNMNPNLNRIDRPINFR